MLHFTRWKMIGILAVVLVGILAAVPNLFSRETVESWPSWVPKRQMVLGLDLQGGAYLLYEVDRQDYVQRRLRTLVGEIRNTMGEEPRIGYTGLGIQGQGVQLRVRDTSQLELARTRLEALRNPLTNSLLAATDTLLVTVGAGGFGGNYEVRVPYVISGGAGIRVQNVSAGSLSEAVVINFAILKGVNA